jgi:hypothetical protein
MSEGLEVGEGLEIYTVYHDALDYPGEYVVRRTVTRPGSVAMDLFLHARGTTLDEVRALLPQGLCRLPPDVQDDPVIVECWL